jgi:hypothetical protein
MVKVGRYLPLIVAVVLGIIFQLQFISCEKADTPSKAAMAFAQAYFQLDGETLSKRLCTASSPLETVNDYLYRVGYEAAQRGFQSKYVKSRIFHMQTHTLELSDDTARVKVVGKRRNAINPVYEYTAKLFSLTRPHEVEAVLDLVKENGQWKVCGKAFGLM